MNYTLTYSEGVSGWVSFYSYYPEWMIGMNNYFYSFKGGNLYRHNVNGNRNTFYFPWWESQSLGTRAFTPTSIQGVFNSSVLENKLFKTITLQGDDSWAVQLSTDLQNSGFIDSDWFELKESSYFAFVRNNSSGQFSLRSLNGIGNSLTVEDAGTSLCKINFSISPLISIGNIISVGDYIYFNSDDPRLAGEVIEVNVDLRNGLNQLVINNNMPTSVTIPGNINFMFYIKNSVAESHGVLGHYCVFTLENNNRSKIELFAVQSDVMKSFP